MAYGQLFDVPDTKKVRFIVHTDCKNEADDQFTLVHILLTQKLDVRGIIGGHFDSSDRKDPDRHDTAQQSAEEVRRILDLMGCADAQTVLTGSDVALPDEQMVALNAELAGMRWPHGETWCLGDEGVICALLQDLEIEDCYDLLPAPRVGADLRYGPGSSERPVRVYRRMDARLDLEDLYAKLQIGWPSA